MKMTPRAVLLALLLALLLLPAAHHAVRLPPRAYSRANDCSNFNGQDSCQGQQVDEPPAMDARRWQTPPRSAPEWQEGFQDYATLVGYARVVYAPDRTRATVSVWTLRRDNSTKLQYRFGDHAPQASNEYAASAASETEPLDVKVTSSDGASLVLEPVDFVWNAPPVVPQWSPSAYDEGQKGAIVEAMGWPYKDIAAECEALGKMGYMGVKVFPPQESILTDEWPQNNELNPWWFMYQPVSYRLSGRAGTRDELRSMIQTCRSHGVRVYADAVNNHMTGSGNDILHHRNPSGGACLTWGPKSSTDGSPYFTEGFAYENCTYTGGHPTQEFPAVPWGPLDFHCNRPLNSWSDPFDLNYGWLTGLCDLNSEKPYVRQRIADYITDLLGIGFSGIRMDAAKHQSPDDLAAILSLVAQNMGGTLPPDFVAWLEVLLGGEKDLLECQLSPYDYLLYFDDVMAKAGLSKADIAKIKIWSSDYPKEFPACGSWILPATRFAVQNDDNDQQKSGSSSRDMGDQGSVLLLDKDVPKHRGFETLLFSRTDGDWRIKLVLSGYTYMDTGASGIPDGLSDCSRCTGEHCDGCLTVPYSPAHDDSVCGYTVYDESHSWAEGAYTRVHRDRAIILAMRGWMGLSTNVTNAEIGLPKQCT